jgi:lipoprotein-anchoring transpeptidase ErfK/SrfK
MRRLVETSNKKNEIQKKIWLGTLKIYAIAVGATGSPSPEGDFKVINRLENPGYYKPGTVVEPGAGNPLGSRWIGLSQKGYGIHGTNAPGSIGKAASHGCIRMRQRDLEELFKLVRVGDTVSIRGERDEQLARLLATEVVTVAANQTENATEGDDTGAAVEIEK